MHVQHKSILVFIKSLLITTLSLVNKLDSIFIGPYERWHPRMVNDIYIYIYIYTYIHTPKTQYD